MTTRKTTARKPKILPDLEAQAKRIAELEAQLVEASKPKLQVKVSQKGAVQINGLRRFPVTFYKGEWEAIFENADRIKQFIKDNESELVTK
jgi:predicted esterase